MQPGKKILSIIIKTLIGAGSLLVVYYRLRPELEAGSISLMIPVLMSPAGVSALLLCTLLVPLNWGIETVKWKTITAPVQPISFSTATRSVYSGVCLGNLAPGRATEFLARVIYFRSENRLKVSVLHFLSGMIQLSVTVAAGLSSVIFRFYQNSGSPDRLSTLSLFAGATVLILAAIVVLNIDPVMSFISRKFNPQGSPSTPVPAFRRSDFLQLFALSFLRYAVFSLQFLLILYALDQKEMTALITCLPLYFLITSLIPMMSLFEGPVRMAVVLLAFAGTGTSEAALVVSALVLWIINIVVPSAIGYLFLLRQNFSFQFLAAGKHRD